MKGFTVNRFEVVAGRPSRGRLWVLLVSVLAILVPLGAISSAQAAVVSRVALSLSASPAIPDESVPVRDLVSPAASGRTVTVQRQSGSSWTSVTSVKTNSAGRFMATVRAGTAGSRTLWRVVALRTSAAMRVISGTRSLSVVEQTLSLSRPERSEPGNNFAVTLSGHASPVRAGRGVEVQRLSDGSWLLVGQATELSTGEYSVRTSVAGTFTYRAVGLQWRSAGSVISRSRVVSVDAAPVVVPPVVVPPVVVPPVVVPPVIVAQTATLTMPTALVRDQAGVATMTVAPVRAGRSVALQVLNNAGVWATVSAGQQSSTGSASFPVNTGFAATFSYRVWTAAAADTTAAASAVHTLKVLPGDRLRAGEVLHDGDSLITPDGRYRLSMQADGNLVERVVTTNRLLWSSLTAGYQSARVVMQYDGNAVVYDGNGTARWQTRSNGSPGQAGGSPPAADTGDRAARTCGDSQEDLVT